MPSLPGPRYWNELVGAGYTGVSIFFVLSGYILAHVYLGGDRVLNRKSFWIARVARIYPMYAVSLLVFAPFAIIGLNSYSGVHKVLRFAVLCVSNFGMLQAWRPNLGGGWNVPSWSVSAEAFFYAVFPFIGVWIWTRNRRPLRLLGLLWLASIFMAILWVLITGPTHADAQLPRFNPVMRLPEFLMGVCAANWQRFTTRTIPKSLAPVAAGLSLAVLPLCRHLPEVVLSNGLLAPLFAALIVGLATQHGRLEKLMSTPILVTLGHASYALYLMHLPVLFWFSALTRKGTAGNVPIYSHDSPVRFLTYLFLTLAVSVAGFYLIERPGRRLILRWAKTGQRNASLARQPARNARDSEPQADHPLAPDAKPARRLCPGSTANAAQEPVPD